MECSGLLRKDRRQCRLILPMNLPQTSTDFSQCRLQGARPCWWCPGAAVARRAASVAQRDLSASVLRSRRCLWESRQQQRTRFPALRSSGAATALGSSPREQSVQASANDSIALRSTKLRKPTQDCRLTARGGAMRACVLANAGFETHGHAYSCWSSSRSVWMGSLPSYWSVLITIIIGHCNTILWL